MKDCVSPRAWCSNSVCPLKLSFTQAYIICISHFTPSTLVHSASLKSSAQWPLLVPVSTVYNIQREIYHDVSKSTWLLKPTVPCRPISRESKKNKKHKNKPNIKKKKKKKTNLKIFNLQLSVLACVAPSLCISSQMIVWSNGVSCLHEHRRVFICQRTFAFSLSLMLQTLTGKYCWSLSSTCVHSIWPHQPVQMLL